MFPIPHETHFRIMQRLFELALQGHSADMLSKLIKQEYPDHRESLSKAVIDRRLRDSFYCGFWVIRKDTKQERTIDLTQITLND